MKLKTTKGMTIKIFCFIDCNSFSFSSLDWLSPVCILWSSPLIIVQSGMIWFSCCIFHSEFWTLECEFCTSSYPRGSIVVFIASKLVIVSSKTTFALSVAKFTSHDSTPGILLRDFSIWWAQLAQLIHLILYVSCIMKKKYKIFWLSSSSISLMVFHPLTASGYLYHLVFFLQ